MLEKPNLPDAAIIDALRAAYSLPVTGLAFLPIGYDSSAWVYRASTEADAFFLKVKKGGVYPPAVTVPRFLQAHGLPEAVVPLPTRTGALWHALDDFDLILYPYVAGEVGMDVGLTDAQWLAFGGVLRRLHAVRLPPDLAAQVGVETFDPAPRWRQMIDRIGALLTRGEFAGWAAEALAAFWTARRAAIDWLVARAVALGRLAAARHLPRVLCHCDIHTANLILDPAGGLHVVDWDQPLLAPRERDLWFVDGAKASLFYQGYGAAAPDPVAMAYYAYEWVVQEIGDFGERVFLLDDVSEVTRADSLRGFQALFDPGNVVDGAYAAEAALPPDLRAQPPMP